jgi:hypothetical protein
MPCWPAFIGWVKVEEADRVAGGVSQVARWMELPSTKKMD